MFSVNVKFFLPVFFAALISQSAFAQSGCTDPAANNYDPAAVTNDGSCVYPATHRSPAHICTFAPDIPESSGIVWADGKLWTHNDSGNPAIIYSIDTTDGHTIQKVYIDNFPNTDWEDITADSNYIYISNTGNNSGTRTDLKVLRVLKSDITTDTVVHVNAQAIAYSYADQTSFASSSLNNYDCESLISIKDSLYLFTKDRGDHKTRVYKLPKVPGTYSVPPYASFDAACLVTGADYNPVTKEVVLIGYNAAHTNSYLWFFNDFQGDSFFTGNKRMINISTGKEWQTEAVCFGAGNRIFISCESTDSVDASLYSLTKDWFTSTVYTTEIHSESELFSYPNPCHDAFFFSGIVHPDSFTFSNADGKVALEGNFKTATNCINTSFLAPGVYTLKITEKSGQSHTQKVIKQ